MPAWLSWSALALVSWGVWAVLPRWLGPSLTPQQSQAWSTLGFLPVLIALGVTSGQSLRGASRKGLAWAAVGGVVSCLGNIPYYSALARGERFAAVVSLTALAPLVTVFLAMVFLGERLNRRQWAGVGLAVAAMWLFNVTTDPAQLFSPAVVVAGLPIALWGLSGFLQKVATNHVPAGAAALVYLGGFLPLGLFYGVTQPWPASLSAPLWGVVIALGFLLAFGNFAVISAYARHGQAAVIAPLVNLYPLVSLTLALMLGDRVGLREMAGIACALVAVAALSWETPPQPIHPSPIS